MFRTTTTAATRPGPQTGLEVMPCKRGWIVQRWHATQHGRAYDQEELAGPFTTKKLASAARRALLENPGATEFYVTVTRADDPQHPQRPEGAR